LWKLKGAFQFIKLKNSKDYYVTSFEVSQTSAKFKKSCYKTFLKYSLKTKISEHVFIKNNKKIDLLPPKS
jgi:hypothetical protein